MGPESRNGIRQEFTVAEIIENCHENREHDKKLAVSEIAVLDSRCGMFSAFAGDQVCWLGPKNRHGTWMRPAVAEKTENYCEMQQDERKRLWAQ